MKNLSFIVALFAILIMTSCQKTETPDVLEIADTIESVEITSEKLIADQELIAIAQRFVRKVDSAPIELEEMFSTGLLEKYPQLGLLSDEEYSELTVNAFQSILGSLGVTQMRGTCPTFDWCLWSCCYWAVYFGQEPYRCYSRC